MREQSHGLEPGNTSRVCFSAATPPIYCMTLGKLANLDWCIIYWTKQCSRRYERFIIDSIYAYKAFREENWGFLTKGMAKPYEDNRRRRSTFSGIEKAANITIIGRNLTSLPLFSVLWKKDMNSYPETLLNLFKLINVKGPTFVSRTRYKTFVDSKS